MGTVPTGKMERELKRAYLRWLKALPIQTNVARYVDEFRKESLAIIAVHGGRAASLGAIAGFPTPRFLDLSPVTAVVFNDMKQAAVQASIAAGLGAKEAARGMLDAGVGKSYRRLERIARTETVSAYWKNSWDSADGLGLVMVWSAEIGDRTCDWCLDMDGQIVEDKEIRDHPNGRCTLVPTQPKRVTTTATVDRGDKNFQGGRPATNA